MVSFCRAGVAASVLVLCTIGAQANPFDFQVNTAPTMSLNGGSFGSPFAVSPNRQVPPKAVATPPRAKPKPAVARKPAAKRAVAAKPAVPAAPAVEGAQPPVSPASVAAPMPAAKKIPVVAKTEQTAKPEPATPAADEKLCARELAAIEPMLRKTLLRVTTAETANETERCSAFREHAEIAAKARELFARCSTGRNREIDVSQMDGALLRAKFVMLRMCPRSGTQASATPLQTGAPR